MQLRGGPPKSNGKKDGRLKANKKTKHSRNPGPRKGSTKKKK